MPNERLLVVVVGPTASGKSDLAVRLALRYGAPVVSADSRQVYRGIPIGTAQPTVEEMQGVPHFFIASHALDEEFSCGRYEAEALDLLGKLFARHCVVVAVGGSGLYVQALCGGMDDLPPVDVRLRASLNERLVREGLEALVEELRRLDPIHHATIDRRNPARVLRALEVCLSAGRPYSELRTGEKKLREFGIVKIGIRTDRKELYERIDRRVDAMMTAGLEAEARRVYPLRRLNSLQTVGYRELFNYFDRCTTLPEAVELIKRNTRRYAKRQLTWFGRDETIRWLASGDTETAVRFIDSCKS